MQRDYRSITLYNNVTPVSVTSSTDVTPIVVTAAAHGFNTGDAVSITGHATNVAANGTFKVTRLSANTFSLQDEFTGADIAGSGGGGGINGVAMKACPLVNVKDYRNIIVQFSTGGTATLNVQIAGSLGKPESLTVSTVAGNTHQPVNFGGTRSVSNTYTYLQVINLDTGAAVNGATGIAATAGDVFLMLEINVNAMTYLRLLPNTFTQGSVTAILLVANNI